MSDFAILGTLFGVIVATVGSIIVVKIQRKPRPSEDSPYEALAKRVVELEKADQDKGRRLSVLEHELDVALGELVRWHQWTVAGNPPPPPSISAQGLAILARYRQQPTSPSTA